MELTAQKYIAHHLTFSLLTHLVQQLDDLGLVGVVLAHHREALVVDLLGLHEELAEGLLRLGHLVLQELVELLLALAVRARVLGVPGVVLDELLDLLEGGVERDLLALAEQLPVVLLLLGDEHVDVVVEETLPLRLIEARDGVVPAVLLQHLLRLLPGVVGVPDEVRQQRLKGRV